MDGGRGLNSVLVFLFPNKVTRLEIEHVEEAHVISKDHGGAGDDRLSKNGAIGFESPRDLRFPGKRVPRCAGKPGTTPGHRP